MLYVDPTRSLWEQYDSKAPDLLDTDDDEQQEDMDAAYCDQELIRRYER